MRAATVEKWIWVLVYGGLLMLALGLAVRGREAGLGALLMVAGAIVALVGAALVWVRSRMRGDGRR